MEAELICSICQDYFLESTTASCSHTFCKICISDWQKHSKLCPVCRQPIKHLVKSQALDALANLAREGYEKEALKSFNKSKAKNINTKATKANVSLETPGTSGSSRSPRSPTTIEDLFFSPQLTSTQTNNGNGRLLHLATFGSTLAGLAAGVVNKKIAERIPAATQLTNILATLSRTKVLGGEMKGILQSAIYKATGKNIPDDVLDAVLAGFKDAGGNCTSDAASSLIADIIDNQYANLKKTRYCNDSSDSHDDGACGNNFNYID